VLAVAGAEPRGLGDFYRRVWSLGEAGVEVPLSIYRDGRAVELRVASADRNRFLRAPRVH
jgi:S1-C subfamily serine protease